MKLILVVLLIIGLAFVLSNPADHQMHTKHRTLDNPREVKNTTDIKHGQPVYHEARVKQFTSKPQKVGYIQRQVRMLIPTDSENESYEEITGEINLKDLKAPAITFHNVTGEGIERSDAIATPQVPPALPRHVEVAQRNDQLNVSAEPLVEAELKNGPLLDAASSLRISRIGDAVELSHPIDEIAGRQIFPLKETERLDTSNTENTPKLDLQRDSENKDVAEKAADIKKREVDDALKVQTESPVKTSSEQIKSLNSANFTDSVQLRENLEKDTATKIDDAKLVKAEVVKERQGEDVEITATIPEDKGITVADPQIKPSFNRADLEKKFLDHLFDEKTNPKEKREVKELENLVAAKTQSKFKDCRHQASVKALQYEEAIEAVVNVRNDIADKLADDQQSDKDVKATRKHRTAAITKKDGITVINEVDKIGTLLETNTSTVLTGEAHRHNRGVEITEGNLEALVEVASIIKNGEQPKDRLLRNKRQSYHDSPADYYSNINKPKPFAVLTAENKATGHYAESFYQPGALKPLQSGSKPASHIKPDTLIDNPVHITASHPKYCNGVHQVIIHDPVHCPVLTCSDFDSVKYEWLLCVYGPMSRVVVLGDGDIPLGDNIFGNYPALQCVCDMGFVMNNVGECIRRSNC